MRINQSANSTTLITSSNPTDLSPIEATLMDLCNLLHEARAASDVAQARRIEAQAFELLDRYDRTDGEDHPNPAWARPNQRAMVLSAAGRVDQAIKLELAALRYADTPRRKEISLGNLTDRFIRLGKADEAVAFFLDAQEESPHSSAIMLTGAQALCIAGYYEQADRIFASFDSQYQTIPHDSHLAAYLDYETRLGDMAQNLPALARLMQRWNAQQAQRQAHRGIQHNAHRKGTMR